MFSVMQSFDYTYKLHAYQSQSGDYLFIAIDFLKKRNLLLLVYKSEKMGPPHVLLCNTCT